VNWVNDSGFRNLLSCSLSAFAYQSVGQCRIRAYAVGVSRRFVAAVDILHVGERDTGTFLPRVIEIERIAR
jgi:hypothetical protein